LSQAARDFWHKYAQALVDQGLLTAVDIPAFILMAEHYALARQSVKQVLSDGLTVIDEDGMERKHPLLQVMRNNSLAFKAFAVEFGMTPSSRSRINLKPPDDDEDELEKLLFGRRAEVKDDSK
jgi:P27 family predicted phage terminase small subunit